MRTLRFIVALAVILVSGIVGVTVMGRSAEDARKAAGIRNLQQWGIALNLYLMDNNNQLPLVGREPVSEDQSKSWFNALPPYISQKPLAELPPGQRPRPGVSSLWISPSSAPVRVWDDQVFYFNYGMNRALQPNPAARSFRTYELKMPQNIIFMTETDGYSPGVTPETVQFYRGMSRSSAPDAVSNVLFADGHVKSLSRQELVLDREARKAERAATGISWFME